VISTDQLVEWVHLDDVKCYERSVERTNAAIINELLLWAHIIEGCQVNHVSNFSRIHEWINQPASANRTLKLYWLLSKSTIGVWKRKDFNLLALFKLFLNHPVLSIAHVAKSVSEAVKNVII